MKHWFLLLLLILSNTLIAQEKKIGYQAISEVSFIYGGPLDYYNVSSSKFSIINGIDIKSRYFTGIGINFFRFNEYDLGSLELDQRFDIIQRKHVPFIFGGISYIFNFNSNQYEYSYHFQNGYSYNLGIGIENKLSANIYLHSKIGYEFQHLETEYKSPQPTKYERIYDLKRFFIGFGLAFK